MKWISSRWMKLNRIKDRSCTSGWKVKPMCNNKGVRNKPARPTVFGIGLTALDVIYEKESRQYQIAAGGTCGNTLCILGYFGWKSAVISRVASDAAGVGLEGGLKKRGGGRKKLPVEPTPKTQGKIEKGKKKLAGGTFSTLSFSGP